MIGQSKKKKTKKKTPLGFIFFLGENRESFPPGAAHPPTPGGRGQAGRGDPPGNLFPPGECVYQALFQRRTEKEGRGNGFFAPPPFFRRQAHAPPWAVRERGTCAELWRNFSRNFSRNFAELRGTIISDSAELVGVQVEPRGIRANSAKFRDSSAIVPRSPYMAERPLIPRYSAVIPRYSAVNSARGTIRGASAAVHRGIKVGKLVKLMLKFS